MYSEAAQGDQKLLLISEGRGHLEGANLLHIDYNCHPSESWKIILALSPVFCFSKLKHSILVY